MGPPPWAALVKRFSVAQATTERLSADGARRVLIEIIGPAGAGKTTLCRALSNGSHRAIVGPDVHLRDPRQIPRFVRTMPTIVPLLVRASRARTTFTWPEIKALCYVRAWHQMFMSPLSGANAILLDHGPVFKLATLHAFGPDLLRTRSFEPWWNEMFACWGSMLSTVIWLDAPDALLAARINTRPQRHAIKGKPEADVVRFLARYRAAFGHILKGLTGHGDPVVLRFDTNQVSIEQIVRAVASGSNGRGCGN
jgi:shikimate kinase